MLNKLNKNKNKLKDKDEIRTTQGNLILVQQAKRRRRFQQIADRHRSTEELLEETRQLVELVEEAREEFLNLYSQREENLDGRELTRTTQSAEEARAWSELFVRNTLPEGRTSEGLSSPKIAVVGIKTPVPNSAGVGVQSAGVGLQNSVGVAGLNNARAQNQVIMATSKEKLPKFDGDGTADPIRHYKTCETIWRANGITYTNEWVRQFPATLREVAIDWFANTDPQKINQLGQR